MDRAPYNIRTATIADIKHIADIEISSGIAFRSVPGLEWIADEGALSEDQVQGWVDQSTVWVAEEEGGRLIGFIACENTEDASHVMQVSVRDDCQQRGIGAALMEKATADARRRGIREMTLTTFHDVAFNGPFYAKMGFQRVEESDLDDRLRFILEKEEADGLPIDRRCAMRMEILAS